MVECKVVSSMCNFRERLNLEICCHQKKIPIFSPPLQNIGQTEIGFT